jgi:hypothetical protein
LASHVTREGTRLAGQRREIANDRPSRQNSPPLRAPCAGTNAHKCDDFGQLYGETRKNQTGCWERSQFELSGDLRLAFPWGRALKVIQPEALRRFLANQFYA